MSDSLNIEFPQLGQGPAVLASEDDLNRDKIGYTHPNLHRRIDASNPEEGSEEVAPRDYQLAIHGANSYRTTIIHHHDEESDDETP